MSAISKKWAPAVAFAALSLAPGLSHAAAISFTNLNSMYGTPYPAGGITYTEVEGRLTPEEQAAHNSAAMTGRIFWMNQTSPRTILPDGSLQIGDLSGKGNHATAAPGRHPQWESTTGGGGFFFDGKTARLDVKGITTAKLPVMGPFTYFVTICSRATPAADPTTGSGYNSILSLGSYGSLLDRGYVNLLQKSNDLFSFVDASAGVEGTSALRSVTIAGGTCSVISGRAHWNGATGYAKTMLDLGDTRAWGTPTLARVNQARLAGQYLTIGGDMTSERTASQLVIPEVQMFNTRVDNQDMTREANAMLRRAGVTAVFRLATVLDPVSVDGNKIDAGTLAWCASGGSRCTKMSQAAMTTHCSGIANPLAGQVIKTPCGSYVGKIFNLGAGDRCVTISIPNEQTGVRWILTAKNVVKDTLSGKITGSSGYSNALTCEPLAPAVP